MVKPPDPQFRIHATFVRVLYQSGAGDHFDKVEDAAEELRELSADGKSDSELLLGGS